jgi:hypothetical protein
MDTIIGANVEHASENRTMSNWRSVSKMHLWTIGKYMVALAFMRSEKNKAYRVVENE